MRPWNRNYEMTALCITEAPCISQGFRVFGLEWHESHGGVLYGLLPAACRNRNIAWRNG